MCAYGRVSTHNVYVRIVCPCVFVGYVDKGRVNEQVCVCVCVAGKVWVVWMCVVQVCIG